MSPGLMYHISLSVLHKPAAPCRPGWGHVKQRASMRRCVGVSFSAVLPGRGLLSQPSRQCRNITCWKNFTATHFATRNTPLPLRINAATRSTNRCLSGGKGAEDNDDEKIAAKQAQVNSKHGGHTATYEAINDDDLKDLNAEIAGFVGSLGDPDFDLEEDNYSAPTLTAANSRRHSGSGSASPVTAGALPPAAHASDDVLNQPFQRENVVDLGGGSDRGSLPVRAKEDIACNTQSRRLTLADHPVDATISGVTHAGDHPARGISGRVEQLQTHGRPSDNQRLPRRAQVEERVQAACSGGSGGGATDAASSHGQPDNNDAGPSALGGGFDGARERRREARSVLVLNGAACFVRGRLSSTGESQESIMSSMRKAAAEFGVPLTVCTSNREDELLEQLCSGNYDAIVYNPAGFREPGFASSTCLTSDARASSDEVDPQQRDSSQQQQMDFAALHCLANRSALEYGLRRARCPVVRIFPRDNIRFETNGFPVERTAIGTGSGNGEHYGVEAGGSIAGFSGVDSYRLAIAAVASMLDES